MHTHWEYRITNKTYRQHELNNEGLDGWELVTVDHFSTVQPGGVPVVAWAVWKRPRES